MAQASFPLYHLSTPHEGLSATDVDAYQENGFILIKKALHPQCIHHYQPAISDMVLRLNTLRKPMAERTTYEKAFLQVTNLCFRTEEDLKLDLSSQTTSLSPTEALRRCREFVLQNKRLGSIAAKLMGCDSVRLYHDQALYKEKAGGITPWHCDQYYWPIEGNCVTAWIPLQETAMTMGPLGFAPKSQNLDLGRDLAISDQSDAQVKAKMREHGIDAVTEPFQVGDVSFHSGWTFHGANANMTDTPREVMTIIFMDGDAKLAEPKEWQIRDREAFCPNLNVGDTIHSPLNPILFP